MLSNGICSGRTRLRRRSSAGSMPISRASGAVLAPVLDPAQRSAEFFGRPRERPLLAEQHALVAEPAADVGRDDADAALVEAETFGEPGAHDVRLLGRRVHHELVEPAV